MCDYSLEIYGSRPAKKGERYVTTRFPSGTMGIAAPGKTESSKGPTAVCMACDTALKFDNIPVDIQKRFGVGASTNATFTRLETGSYRDGVQFENGQVCSLQQLPPGIDCFVEALLEDIKLVSGHGDHHHEHHRETVPARAG